MDLTKYYPDIVAKYPAYVTKRELCEICHICPKTAYNLEQQGEIPYTIEQNHLIRSHKIKLTDILAYLYRRECRQEADSPYICAMRTFYDEHLSPYGQESDALCNTSRSALCCSAVFTHHDTRLTRQRKSSLYGSMVAGSIVLKAKSLHLPKDAFSADFLINDLERSNLY